MIRRNKRQQTKRRIFFVSLLLILTTGFLFQPVLAQRMDGRALVASASVSASLGLTEAGIRFIPATAALENQPAIPLVNKNHALAPDYVPADLVTVSATVPGISCDQLSAPAAAAFELLSSTAASEGYTILLRSGYRSYDTQKRLFDSYVSKDGQYVAEQYSAPPGCSEHQLGLAADVTSPAVNNKLEQSFGSTPEGIWLAENAHRFGFIIRYMDGKQDITGYIYEPWHIRYVGNEAALEIYQSGLTLEECLNTY